MAAPWYILNLHLRTLEPLPKPPLLLTPNLPSSNPWEDIQPYAPMEAGTRTTAVSPVPKSPPQHGMQSLPPTATHHPPTHINPSIFAVIMGPNATAPPWVPTPLTGLALIRKAANESGPDYPYFEQVHQTIRHRSFKPITIGTLC